MKYRVLHENYDEDGWAVEASSAERAAEKFAEEYDESGDRPLLSNEDRSEDVVVVADNGSRSVWSIRAYTLIRYSASPATPERAKEGK